MRKFLAFALAILFALPFGVSFCGSVQEACALPVEASTQEACCCTAVVPTECQMDCAMPAAPEPVSEALPNESEHRAIKLAQSVIAVESETLSPTLFLKPASKAPEYVQVSSETYLEHCIFRC